MKLDQIKALEEIWRKLGVEQESLALYIEVNQDFRPEVVKALSMMAEGSANLALAISKLKTP